MHRGPSYRAARLTCGVRDRALRTLTGRSSHTSSASVTTRDTPLTAASTARRSRAGRPPRPRIPHLRLRACERSRIMSRREELGPTLARRASRRVRVVALAAEQIGVAVRRPPTAPAWCRRRCSRSRSRPTARRTRRSPPRPGLAQVAMAHCAPRSAYTRHTRGGARLTSSPRGSSTGQAPTSPRRAP